LIAVIGAGIGGFAAALLLSCAGFPVTLIEKRARSEEESAGLQLSPNASRILIKAGLGPAILAVEALHSVQSGYVVNL